MKTDLRVFDSVSDLADAAAALLAEWVRDAVEKRGLCTLGLSGGSTPGSIHRSLSAAPYSKNVPWERVEFYFGDERAVPADHAESNVRSARETLLEPLGIASQRIHPMRPEAEQAAALYDAILPDRLDVLILGMGPDGHTASLFPGQSSLDESVRRVVLVRGPKPPPIRLTITPPVIASARRVLMLATGAGKAEAVARALDPASDPKRTPAALARSGTWLLDAEAASLLDPSQ